jgi:hypothetical protein
LKTDIYYTVRLIVRAIFWTAVVTGSMLAIEALGKLITW